MHGDTNLRPSQVYNVDGTPNDAGLITNIVDAEMTYQDHMERVYLAVTQLGKQEVILGYTWLAKHNPEIDFSTSGVKMTCCRQTRGCMGCEAERHAEKIIH